MAIVDYEMAEKSAELILNNKLKNNEQIPKDLCDNFIMALANILVDKMKIGPNVILLMDEIKTCNYDYNNISDSYSFDLGASYGATKLFKNILASKNSI